MAFLSIGGDAIVCHWHIWHLSVSVVVAEQWSCMELLTHSLYLGKAADSSDPPISATHGSINSDITSVLTRASGSHNSCWRQQTTSIWRKWDSAVLTDFLAQGIAYISIRIILKLKGRNYSAIIGWPYVQVKYNYCVAFGEKVSLTEVVHWKSSLYLVAC